MRLGVMAGATPGGIATRAAAAVPICARMRRDGGRRILYREIDLSSS